MPPAFLDIVAHNTILPLFCRAHPHYRLCALTLTYTSPSNMKLQMNCDKRHGRTAIAKHATGDFATCTETCAFQNDCRSVDYQEIRSTCYLSAYHGEPTKITPCFSSAYVNGELNKANAENARDQCRRLLAIPHLFVRFQHRALLLQIYRVEIKALALPSIQIF